jgi:hypothetical protein
MSRTVITAQTLVGSYPSLPLAGGSADLTETAVDDPTDRYTALVNGKTVVLAHNTDTNPHTITFTSVEDSFHRKGDITAYSIAAGKIARFGPFQSAGWADAGNLDIDVSDPLVRLAVITLP